MGQYYYVINLDKRQYLHPHRAGDGLKLLEFACSANGTMTCLAVLLADGNGRGGGDLGSDDPVVGSWAGDRIVISGDYADALKFVDDATLAVYRDKCMTDAPAADHEEIQASKPTLQSVADKLFEDITTKVLVALADDRWLRDHMVEQANSYLFGQTLKESPELRAKLGVTVSVGAES